MVSWRNHVQEHRKAGLTQGFKAYNAKQRMGPSMKEGPSLASPVKRFQSQREKAEEKPGESASVGTKAGGRSLPKKREQADERGDKCHPLKATPTGTEPALRESNG